METAAFTNYRPRRGRVRVHAGYCSRSAAGRSGSRNTVAAWATKEQRLPTYGETPPRALAASITRS
jgi:hypothetical protein